ncbi:recombinase family protein [Chloroflexota bacterium]
MQMNTDSLQIDTVSIRAFLMLRLSSGKQKEKYGAQAQRRDAYESNPADMQLEFSDIREATIVEPASGWDRKKFAIEMQKRCEEFQRHEWEILVFPRVDRESRFLAGSFEYLLEALKTGMAIYFARDNLVLRQGDTEAFDRYFDLVRDARSYIKVLKINISRGKEEAMEAGKIPCGWGPWGLAGYDWAGGKFHKNSVAGTVETILRRYLGGMSQSAIVRELDRRNLLSQTGRPWTQGSVSKVLHHARWYAGTITFNKREFKDLI